MNTDAKIAILGYGIEGKSTEKYLQSHGFVNISILDGKDIFDDLKKYEYIFRTPGISPLHPAFVQAKKDGVVITSHIEYFYKHCPAKIVAVTGTKGKGTTSSLIQKIIEQSDRKCFLGGNIGLPPLNFLDEVTADDIVVLETSSFQSFQLDAAPYVGVALMVTSEHLDYHADIQEYVDAKADLFIGQKSSDHLVYNSDFERTKEIAKKSLAKKYTFSLDDEHEGFLCIDGEKIIKISEICLLGKHNWNNVLAAVHVAHILGVSVADMKQAVSEFSGLPLRLEVVAEKNGILYVNDSFSTTPETTLAALESFAEKDAVVFLGGSDKKSDYSDLVEYIQNHKNVVPFCFGETGKILFSLIGEKAYYHEFLSESFEAAQKINTPGSVCLLSPASASLDQFDNYKVRGEYFTKLCT
ncbi:UDP-N-acetylmuramoyl-L-alanine--D-glutamate ligase [Candidatus Peregrinibacteria bacterium]|nr:MAG: UDP-N-acetylmuramoyl-L-alanine--D-glutamate ligase [Candidatus Peregrinibacteria bacterium]